MCLRAAQEGSSLWPCYGASSRKESGKWMGFDAMSTVAHRTMYSFKPTSMSDSAIMRQLSKVIVAPRTGYVSLDHTSVSHISGHSDLKESIGLTLDARRAGRKLARKATVAKRTETLASVATSKGSTP